MTIFPTKAHQYQVHLQFSEKFVSLESTNHLDVALKISGIYLKE
jgi:hypothetical protein